MRYFFHIGYHGGKYSGWQKHRGIPSVQDVLEAALSRILKTPIEIIGCGRTDALVHAAQFFFHTDIDAEWDFDLLFRLNKVLKDDIAVFDVIPMQGQPHARFDAIQRSYDYYIHTYKDPFLSRYSSYYNLKNLDLDNMNKAILTLPLYQDYRAFCKSPNRNGHTLCYVSTAKLFISPNGDRVRFHLSANRFLGKMIRIIAERLIRIGTGEMNIDEFEHYLQNPSVPQVIVPAHPQGLYLTKVTYPYLDFPVRTEFMALLQQGLSEYQ